MTTAISAYWDYLVDEGDFVCGGHLFGGGLAIQDDHDDASE